MAGTNSRRPVWILLETTICLVAESCESFGEPWSPPYLVADQGHIDIDKLILDLEAD